MTTDRIINDLKSIGLNKKESEVYLFCLKNKRSTPRSIEKGTGISRSSIYKYLDFLILKKLIFIKKRKKEKFYLSSPIEESFSRIKKELEEEINKFDEIQSALKHIEKKTVNNTQEDDFIFSNGLDHFNEILLEILKNKENTYWIGSSKNMDILFESQKRKLRKEYSLKRMNNTSLDYGISIGKLPKKFYYENNKTNFYKEIEGFDNVNSIMAFTETYFVIVKNININPEFILTKDKDIINLFRIIFRELWQKI